MVAGLITRRVLFRILIAGKGLQIDPNLFAYNPTMYTNNFTSRDVFHIDCRGQNCFRSRQGFSLYIGHCKPCRE